jgi:hypothetical protein
MLLHLYLYFLEVPFIMTAVFWNMHLQSFADRHHSFS